MNRTQINGRLRSTALTFLVSRDVIMPKSLLEQWRGASSQCTRGTLPVLTNLRMVASAKYQRPEREKSIEVVGFRGIAQGKQHQSHSGTLRPDKFAWDHLKRVDVFCTFWFHEQELKLSDHIGVDTMRLFYSYGHEEP